MLFDRCVALNVFRTVRFGAFRTPFPLLQYIPQFLFPLFCLLFYVTMFVTTVTLALPVLFLVHIVRCSPATDAILRIYQLLLTLARSAFEFCCAFYRVCFCGFLPVPATIGCAFNAFDLRLLLPYSV